MLVRCVAVFRSHSCCLSAGRGALKQRMRCFTGGGLRRQPWPGHCTATCDVQSVTCKLQAAMAWRARHPRDSRHTRQHRQRGQWRRLWWWCVVDHNCNLLPCGSRTARRTCERLSQGCRRVVRVCAFGRITQPLLILLLHIRVQCLGL